MNSSNIEITMKDIRTLLQTRSNKKKRKINTLKTHGDKLGPKDSNSIRIYYQNIKGIQNREDIYEYMEAIKDYDVNIWGWSKTNINWTPKTIAAVKYMTTNIFDNCFFETSNSDNPARRNQQDGT